MRFTPCLAACALALCGAAQAFDPRSLSPEIDPCSDFYGHVNARWMAATVLPADRGRIGSFDELRVLSAQRLERALAEAAAAPERPATPGVRLVAADYAAGLDTAAIESRGLGALAPWLERIAGLKSAAELPALLGALARVQVGAPLAASVGPDSKDKRRNLLALRAAGLGLPDRGDYTADDANTRRVLAAYRVYLRRLLDASGGGADDDTVDAILGFETRLAASMQSRAALRDPNAVYNVFTAATLATAAPGFDWAAFITAYSGRTADGLRFVLSEPAFASALAQQAASLAPATWRAYLRVRLLDALAPRLPKTFAQAHFDYHSAAVRGLRQPPPRAEEVLLDIGASAIGEGLGELYVARHFPPRAQARALLMVADVKAAMHTRIQGLAWMSAATKQRAVAKLDAMVAKIGAPAQWRRYAGLVLQRDDFAGNRLRAAEWQTAERLAELDTPVDRSRWNTSPHIVNAFAGGQNDIIFPAAILQPPFFDDTADDALNYGGIGAVIGHEITHHFDDRGRQFDADGNLADWWAPEDAAAYRSRADRVAALYSGYEPTPGQRIVGRQTLGENISDFSGVQLAFDALQIALKRSTSAEKIDGFTPQQRFFISYATIWRSKLRTEALVNQLRTGAHSPGPYRVLGPLSNMAAFAATFQCTAGSSMAAPDPITVW
jgi:putative endopeptidase